MISELILDLCCHGFLENLCAYLSTCLLFLSLVAFTKSFLKLFGLITCDNNYLCYTVLTAIKARDSCLWYLDSGCSRHMTGNKGLFKTLLEGKIRIVTFGDGSKSVIRGIGTVDIPGLPVFEDVWYQLTQYQSDL